MSMKAFFFRSLECSPAILWKGNSTAYVFMDIFQIIGATISKVLLFLLESDSQGKNFQIFGDKIISTVGDGYLFW